MATRFKGRFVLIRACDYKVKVEMCPALQPPPADRSAPADLAAWAAADGTGCPVSPFLPCRSLPTAPPRAGLCSPWGKGTSTILVHTPRCVYHAPSFSDCRSAARNDNSERDRPASLHVQGRENKEIQTVSERDTCHGGGDSWGQQEGSPSCGIEERRMVKEDGPLTEGDDGWSSEGWQGASELRILQRAALG